MGFPRQKYWSRLQFPSPGDLPDPEVEPTSPALAGRFFTTGATWGNHLYYIQFLHTPFLKEKERITLARGRWSRVTRLPFPGDLGSIPLLGPWDWAEHPAAPSLHRAWAALPILHAFAAGEELGSTQAPPQPRAEAEKVWRASLGDDSGFHSPGGRGVPCWGLWSGFFTPTPWAQPSLPGLWGRASQAGQRGQAGWQDICASLRPFP